MTTCGGSVKRWGYSAASTMARAFAFVLLALALLPGGTAQAHEIEPSVIDITLQDGAVRLDVSANLETYLAGIGPGHDDTDAAPEAAAYDALRLLSGADLEAAFADFAPTLLDGFALTAAGERVVLEVESVSVPPTGDIDIARLSDIVLVGAVPPGADAVSFEARPVFGEIVLRGTGENVEYAEFLTPGAASQPIAVAGATVRSAGDVFVQYLGVGFEHILPLGLDHILFVIGLFLLSAYLRPLLWQVTAFTLAHTVTLGLGAADIVRVPGSIVEPLIALSIVYVCVENVLAKGLTKWRPLIIFAFGLLHGLGFASVFEEYGIPDGQFLPALAAFNIGVEAGQLTVIAACFLLVGWFRDRPWYRRAITIPGSILIGLIGLYWFLTRIGVMPEFLPGL